MAATSIPTRAPSANPCDTFDPAAWLSRFRDAGGWWVVGADDRILIGWTARNSNWIKAPALWREIETNPGKCKALEQALIEGADSLPQGVPARYAGRSLYLATIQPREPAFEEPVQRAADPHEAWKSAMDAFERADRFEALFRETVFNPIDADMPAGDPLYEAADRAMDQVNGVTDQARRVALRLPAPNGHALRWKLEQFLVEKVMPYPPAGEIEQIFADFDHLVGGDHGRD